MENEIAFLLTETFDGSTTSINEVSEVLEKHIFKESFFPVLFDMIVSKQFPENIRLSASIYICNLCKNKWELLSDVNHDYIICNFPRLLYGIDISLFRYFSHFSHIIVAKAALVVFTDYLRVSVDLLQQNNLIHSGLILFQSISRFIRANHGLETYFSHVIDSFSFIDSIFMDSNDYNVIDRCLRIADLLLFDLGIDKLGSFMMNWIDKLTDLLVRLFDCFEIRVYKRSLMLISKLLKVYGIDIDIGSSFLIKAYDIVLKNTEQKAHVSFLLFLDQVMTLYIISSDQYFLFYPIFSEYIFKFFEVTKEKCSIYTDDPKSFIINHYNLDMARDDLSSAACRCVQTFFKCFERFPDVILKIGENLSHSLLLYSNDYDSYRLYSIFHFYSPAWLIYFRLYPELAYQFYLDSSFVLDTNDEYAISALCLIIGKYPFESDFPEPLLCIIQILVTAFINGSPLIQYFAGIGLANTLPKIQAESSFIELSQLFGNVIGSMIEKVYEIAYDFTEPQIIDTVISLVRIPLFFEQLLDYIPDLLAKSLYLAQYYVENLETNVIITTPFSTISNIIYQLKDHQNVLDEICEISLQSIIENKEVFFSSIIKFSVFELLSHITTNSHTFLPNYWLLFEALKPYYNPNCADDAEAICTIFHNIIVRDPITAKQQDNAKYLIDLAAQMTFYGKERSYFYGKPLIFLSALFEVLDTSFPDLVVLFEASLDYMYSILSDSDFSPIDIQDCFLLSLFQFDTKATMDRLSDIVDNLVSYLSIAESLDAVYIFSKIYTYISQEDIYCILDQFISIPLREISSRSDPHDNEYNKDFLSYSIVPLNYVPDHVKLHSYISCLEALNELYPDLQINQYLHDKSIEGL